MKLLEKKGKEIIAKEKKEMEESQNFARELIERNNRELELSRRESEKKELIKMGDTLREIMRQDSQPRADPSPVRILTQSSEANTNLNLQVVKANTDNQPPPVAQETLSAKPDNYAPAVAIDMMSAKRPSVVTLSKQTTLVGGRYRSGTYAKIVEEEKDGPRDDDNNKGRAGDPDFIVDDTVIDSDE